jgi:hypothetical protein
VVEAAIEKNGTYMTGRGGNEKESRGEEEEKETQMRGPGIGIFAICMYTCVAFGSYSQKNSPPSPLPRAEREHGDRLRAQGRRRRRRRSPSKRCRRRRRRLVVGPVVAVEDELGAAVGQAGDQRGCNEAEHRKEGLRPSGLVGGGGHLCQRPAVDAFIEAKGVGGGATAAQYMVKNKEMLISPCFL